MTVDMRGKLRFSVENEKMTFVLLSFLVVCCYLSSQTGGKRMFSPPLKGAGLHYVNTPEMLRL